MKQNKSTFTSWMTAATSRRFLLFILVLVPTLIASGYMAQILPRGGHSALERTIVILFGLLLAWISLGFWTAGIGFISLLLRFDRFTITRSTKEEKIDEDGRTAIIIPIYNEDVERVFAGLRTTWRSLERSGNLDRFHFFLLSDTTDPDIWVDEETAWADICRELNGRGRIFYRRRQSNRGRKSGNVADFCRRWGRSYSYMVVFDADSIMTGRTLSRMVKTMEDRPDIGILQTVPMPVNRESLIARVQQFASHLYGPIFAAGLHFWQLGDAQFWGHNAIIRIEPFMKHCALPRLPGPPPLGGDILSHDFVEAAFMRRAGWNVWLAFDLDGSYEEVPPTLLDELKRDRRWCQGNLQHLRLLFTEGLRPIHRALFLNGVMSYASALLWLVFLLLSSLEASLEVFAQPNYFPGEFLLFPKWPVWYPGWALKLMGSTAVVLFLPKILAILLVVLRGRTRLFGGMGRLVASVMMEVLLSTLLAPIRMLFHSRFVVATLLGSKVGWGPQQRDDHETGWLEALRFHGSGMILGLLWGWAIMLINPGFFWWLSPIISSLILSPIISVLTSRRDLGLALRRRKFFLTPAETDPPRELMELREETSRSRVAIGKAGFVRAVVDPRINALHLSLIRRKSMQNPGKADAGREIMQRALTAGPQGLSRKDRMTILRNADILKELHRVVWELPGGSIATAWAIAPTPQGGSTSVC